MPRPINLQKITNQLALFSNLQGQKLSYHEAGHVLVSYSLNITCQYISCQFQVAMNTVPNAIEMHIESQFQVNHNIPNWLAVVLTNMQGGMSINATSATIGVSRQAIELELKKYAQILVAGEVAEKYFKSMRLWFLRRKVMKFGVRLSDDQMETDIGRLRMIQRHINFDERSYRRNVKKLIKTGNNFNVLKNLAIRALERQVLYQDDIEAVLAANNFIQVQFQL